MPWMGYEPTIPEFEPAKTNRTLHSAATVIGCTRYIKVYCALSQFLHESAGLVPGLGQYASFQILSTSSFLYHAVIQRHMVLATCSIIKQPPPQTKLNVNYPPGNSYPYPLYEHKRTGWGGAQSRSGLCSKQNNIWSCRESNSGRPACSPSLYRLSCSGFWNITPCNQPTFRRKRAEE
jgi:hypothetical protein